MTTYTPVAYVYREIAVEEIEKKRSGKIFFFNTEDKVDEQTGRITQVAERPDGLFIVLEPEFAIRLDRVITIFGKPGPAFDEYDSFANQCLSCTGGYEL